MATRTQVNSATGVMGPSGSGKSSLAATLAKYLWRRWKKVLLYSNSDGGGFPAEVQACIAAGIIRVFRMRTRDTHEGTLSFETCQRVCQGWWPKRINPATGEVPPGVEMVPPITLQFAMSCAQGHYVKTVPFEAMLNVPAFCPQCKKPVTKADMRVTKSMLPTPGFEDVGGVFMDGLSSMLAWELMEMGHRAGRMELRGEEGSIGGKVTSGDLKFGGSTRSHVGFVQARGEELVHLTLGIPNLVVPPIFTMLTHEDVDERSLNIRGPKISGRAKTDEAPQWFGNMLETAKIPAILGAGEQRVLYLSEFTDERGVRHLCKHRGSPGTMPAYLIDPTEDPAHPELAFTQFNLGVFFEMLDGALEQRVAAVMEEFPDAPGVPEGMVEIGLQGLPAAEKPAVVQTGPATLKAAPPSAQPAPAPPAAPVAPAPRGRKKAAEPPPTPVPVQAAPAGDAPAATLPLEDVVESGAGNGSSPAATPPLAAPPAPRPSAAAPPAGRRPGTPAMAAGRPSGPPGVPPLGPVTVPGASTPGTPAGARVNGPTAPAPMRAPAAAPRPPQKATS